MSSGAPASLPHLGLLLSESYVVTAQQGTYDLIGQAAGLQYSGSPAPDSPAPLPSLGLLAGFGGVAKILTAAAGAYSVTGQDAASLRQYLVAADAGSYTLTGQIAALSGGISRAGDPAPLPHIGLLLGGGGVYVLGADTGSYSIVGSDGVLDFEVFSEPGTYALTGQNAGLLKSTVMVAESGSYSLSGQDATFSIGGVSRTMLAEAGAYSLAGQDAATLRQYPMPAEQGFYALLGQAATLSLGFSNNYVMPADGGAYALAGLDATLTRSAPVLQCETGYYTIVGGDVVGIDPPTGHGFEMGGGGALNRRKRRNLVYLEPEKEAPSKVSRETQPQIVAKARQEAEEIIRVAAETHAKALAPEATRFANVRTALKPVAKDIGNWNWVSVYQRMYDKALTEQLRQELAIQDQIDEEDAVIMLLLET